MNTQVSVLNVLAWSLWIGGLVAIVYDVALGLHALGHLGIILSSAGATLHVRGFCQNLKHRELAAFELGRNSVRSLR